MNPHWRSFLESSKAVFVADTVSGVATSSTEILNFGDSAGELAAGQNGTVLVPLTHLGLIAAKGEEAKSFLHNQFTSDINHLGQGQAQHAAWCTAKGRMQASFLAWRDGDAFHLAIAADLQEAAQKRLQMFILRAKVKLASLSEQQLLLGLSGPQAAVALANADLPCPDAAMTTAAKDGCTVIRLDDNRFIISTPQEQGENLWSKLTEKARPAGLPVWRWLDIQAGLPVICAATREEFVPQMADFEKIGGVSFHKGCYPGQEIVARTQYLGKVKRHLYRLRSDVALQAGDELHSPEHPDQSSGKVVSAAPSPTGGYEALAVVQAGFADSLHLGTADGPRVQASAVNP